ncbi:MAG: enoyl-CoA hydratase-related protein [Oscillospiraceae bacterium]|nr:enoyl-CoA hydratase-related protein [Oscillospiraceae bacterium]
MNISLAWRDAIALITVNRPEQLNALNAETIKELDAAIDTVSANADCRAVIVTGAGEKAFVAGADIKAMEGMTAEEARDFSKSTNDVFHKLQRLRVPVIAAVNGFALGGGCELAMSCDIRLASENAVFALPETSLGLMPGFGGTQRLARIVGYAKAAEMVFTSQKIRADKALEIGLVNAVYPLESLLDQAYQMAEAIAAQAPIAVQRAKRVMQQGLESSLEEGLLLEATEFGQLFHTKDARGGLRAFIQKEKYQYEGK